VVCETYIRDESVIHRVDPRVRVVAAALFSIVVAVSQRFAPLAAAAVLALGLVGAARVPPKALARRLGALGAFLIMLWVVLPLTTPGQAACHLGSAGLSRAGLALAGRITLKSSAIVLALTALLSTMEPASLGHALRHLGVPAKLAHLLLMTVRYLDVLHHEYERLVRAMKVRCFRPRMTRHTYRSLGYLVGMLLVGSFDRSGRIQAAMKCRGFRGEFHPLDHFRFGRRDAAFALGAAALLASLALAEWTWPTP
jgi:cobalt/nickel transport system permease protein